MKVVILAGGLGSRLTEETISKPKPLIEIGTMPIIWHIMKIYSYYGLNDFVICCGYKGNLVKEFFYNYSLHTTDVTIDVKKNKLIVHDKRTESWKVTLVNTGEFTATGGRIKMIKDYVGDTFCLTYGDGLCSINIKNLIKFHINNKKLATVSAVRPPGRFGALHIKGNSVVNFQEKPTGDGGRINGGYFVLSKKIFDYIKDKDTVWEKEPLENLAKNNQLAAYIFNEFWYAMDTLRDKIYLENLWLSNKAPWKVWSKD
jgi:glucose-1-phosphate cytidylyltransferase